MLVSTFNSIFRLKICTHYNKSSVKLLCWGR